MSDVQRVHPIWLARSFLVPAPGGLRAKGQDWRQAGHWFLLWGLVVGAVYAAVFRATWRWFGEYQYIRFVPIAVVLCLDLAWGGYYQLRAAVDVFTRRSGDPDPDVLRQVVVLMLISILKFAMLLSLPLGETEWLGWRREYLGVLYPRPIYRPLVLMPLWGKWAAMLALCLGRPQPDLPTWFQEMTSGFRLRYVVAGWFACTLLTLMYACESAAEVPRGTIVALGVLMVAYLVGFVMARRFAGQSPQTVLAASLVTEFAFLALYLPVVSNLFHY